MILDEFPEVAALPNAQKLQLVSELLDKVSADAPPLTSAQIEFLEQRVKYNEAHPDEAYSTEQVMERLAELKRRRGARVSRG
jgi:putative addiction module component (TIGR02574 family)